jgi:hypothetical protein
MASRSTKARPNRFNMLLTEDEHAMLVGLAQAQGLTASDVLRQLLRAAFVRDRFGLNEERKGKRNGRTNPGR